MRSLKTLIAAAAVLAVSIGVPAALMAPAASAAALRAGQGNLPPPGRDALGGQDA
jgi:hypothetical protein